MPELDFPELEFEAARAELLRQIDVPELADIQNRARTIRRRRRTAAVAGAALACLAVLGSGTALITTAVGRAPAPVAASPDPLSGGHLWQGGGLTLHGLNGPVLDQPGQLREVQFADAERGYALTAQCGPGRCTVAVAATADGGRTWVDWPVPFNTAPEARVPALVPVGSDGLILVGDSAWFGSSGHGWQSRSIDAPPAVSSVSEGSRLWLRQALASGCTTSPVEVWRPDGTLARLASQPPIGVCWVAPAPAADGAWWVGGTQEGVPAVAVSRNAGQSWTVAALPPAIGGAWAQVSTVGAEVYASVVSPRGGNPYPETLTIRAVYRSLAGGPFSLYTQEPGTLIGDVVALLDGRLVAAGPNWYVCAGAGADLTPARGSMPWTHRIQRTPGAWVTYDLFQAGWAATSRDGESWQKINVR